VAAASLALATLSNKKQIGMALFVWAGNTKGGSITVPLTSCLTGLDLSVLKIKTKMVSCHTADSKPVKQKINGTVILPPFVFPGLCYASHNVAKPRQVQLLSLQLLQRPVLRLTLKM